MSLVVRISVNNDTLFWVTAQRQHPVMTVCQPDTVCTYGVERVEADPFRPIRSLGLLEHRYGDGAVVLARKMLERAEASR